MEFPALANVPLPMLTALLCVLIAVLVARLELGVRRATIFLSAMFGLCALEAMLVAARFGYGIESMIGLQRVLPLFLGPMMYLGFLALCMSWHSFVKHAAIHLSLPVLIMVLGGVLLEDLRILDWFISASYVFYATALFLLWLKGPDAMIYARVGVARSLSNWVLRGLGLLVFILVLDTTIALDFAFNAGSNVSMLISYGTIPLIVVLLAVLMTLPSLVPGAKATGMAAQNADQNDTDLEARIHALMVDDGLFLDPELTVQRLAKRLHVPARQVSTAINRTNSINVSQYVNKYRLQHAADLLQGSNESVTKIAEKSGFMTRSNFYREFQRVYGCSPSDYRKSGSDDTSL